METHAIRDKRLFLWLLALPLALALIVPTLSAERGNVRPAADRLALEPAVGHLALPAHTPWTELLGKARAKQPASDEEDSNPTGLVLAGVIVIGESRTAFVACNDIKDGLQDTYQVGDSIGSYELTTIEADHVVVTRRGETFRIPLGSTAESKPQTRTTRAREERRLPEVGETSETGAQQARRNREMNPETRREQKRAEARARKQGGGDEPTPVAGRPAAATKKQETRRMPGASGARQNRNNRPNQDAVSGGNHRSRNSEDSFSGS